MLRLLGKEVEETLNGMDGDDRVVRGTIATGKLAAPFMKKYVELVQKKFPNVQIEVRTIKNHFFGEAITVSGLITGQDLRDQLIESSFGDVVLIPCNMLRSGESVFLDDFTVTEISEKVGKDIIVVDEGGESLVNSIIAPYKHRKMKRRQIYEQTSSSYRGQT